MVYGVMFRADTESAVARRFVARAGQPGGYWLVTANLDHVRRAHATIEVRGLLAAADEVVADGTPVVWASRIAGHPLPERVAGSNLVWLVAAEAAAARKSIHLVGGDPGVADRAARTLSERHPDLRVTGTTSPPPGFEGSPPLVAEVHRALAEQAPDIVLVALGFPKQDRLIREIRAVLPSAAMVGVGIGLSFVTGDIRRAPAWMHRLGLEWLHRLVQEPARLSRRYLLNGMPFALRMFASALRHRVGPTRKESSRWGSVDAEP